MTKINSTPFKDQKPGTSGLRKKVKHFQQAHYLENFVQSVFNIFDSCKNKTLVLGGDGRFYNKEAIQIILRMAAANEFKKIIVGQNGLLSTPAASLLIRKYQTDGGIILSASHNPGGPDADFGIKFNSANGGPAPEKITEVIYKNSLEISHYFSCESQAVDISKIDKIKLQNTEIEIIDSVIEYADLMESIFDFPIIRSSIKTGSLHLCFDAMHAVTGPYAKEIFVKRLYATEDSVINKQPSEDFNGGHPDPNLAHAEQLLEVMQSNHAPDLGAASDGDGDRNMILGRNFFVTPSDSLAIMTANAHYIQEYKSGPCGVARSMPTSRAVDIVAEKLGIDCYETPTGWKYFGNLLDANKITFCGEESFGSGADHIREKDGIWAVLFWLNLLAVKKKSVKEIVHNHWKTFGRHYYERHDFEAIDSNLANNVMETLNKKLANLANQTFDSYVVNNAYNFSYIDPVDNHTTHNQGIVIEFGTIARVIFRLSGTGTEGATIRVYLEQYEHDTELQHQEVSTYLAPLAKIAMEISEIITITGRSNASVIT